VTALAHPGHRAGGGWEPAAALAVIVLLAIGYLLAAGRVRAAGDGRGGWSRWRTAAWLGGCAVLAAAALPMLGGGDPRGHVVRHLLLGMVAPLGLVLAAPVTLVLRVAAPPVRRTVARVLRSRPLHVLAHPGTAAVLSTGGLYLVMLTPLSVTGGDSPLLHLHYLASGYLFAWAVAGPDPAPRRPGMAARAGALLAAAAAHAFLAKYVYAHAGALPFGTGVDVAAVRSAARLMYYGGDVAELLLAIALFAGWYRRRGRRPPAVRGDERVGLCGDGPALGRHRVVGGPPNHTGTPVGQEPGRLHYPAGRGDRVVLAAQDQRRRADQR
jgi:putative membrane protein